MSLVGSSASHATHWADTAVPGHHYPTSGLGFLKHVAASDESPGFRKEKSAGARRHAGTVAVYNEGRDHSHTHFNCGDYSPGRNGARRNPGKS